MKHVDPRLTVVSNRLPVVLQKEQDRWQIASGSGGLVSALLPALQRRRATWVGWSGAEADDIAPEQEARLLRSCRAELGCELQPVPLSREDIDGFYSGFSNRVLWPLFHGLWSECEFESSHFATYEQVNEAFAAQVLRHSDPDGLVWVHDYQLMFVGQAIRRRAVTPPRLAFFLHIPFPDVGTLAKLPWRRQVLEALLSHDVITFQTKADQRNFISAVRVALPHSAIAPDARSDRTVVELGKRKVTVGHAAIGVDFERISADAGSAVVSERVAEMQRRLSAETVMLGVDRLDYTKGLPQRLEAFADLLEGHPEYRGKLVLLQVVVPSRESVPAYQRLKRDIDRLVGRINGQYSTPAWVPIHHQYGSVSREQLLSLYRLADVSLVTSLKDGMNLVSKEYCASRIDEDGVLVLSEFAGSARQLSQGALLVNPFDRDSLVDAMHQACTMPREARVARMKSLRRVVARDRVQRWAERCLQQAWGLQETVPRRVRTEQAAAGDESAGRMPLWAAVSAGALRSE